MSNERRPVPNLPGLSSYCEGEQATKELASIQAKLATHFSGGVTLDGRGKLKGYWILHSGQDDAILMPFTEDSLNHVIAALQKIRSDVYGAGGS